MDYCIYGNNIDFSKIKGEFHRFETSNNLSEVDGLVREITSGMEKLLTNEELINVSIGISEMVTNAIEHGNLELDYFDKTKFIEEGTYYKELQDRAKNPNYNWRKVCIECTYNSEIIVIVIKDNGIGFDWQNHPPSCVDHIMETHGRGIKIARFYFDKVIFNNSGNEVTLVKLLARGK